VPIRPAQTPPETLKRWAARRQEVGGRIRALRLERGLSQESVALEAGMSRNTLIGVEWGRKSLAYERLWDLAAALDVRVSDLIEDS
jgi:transcriptional regulator with XRE-family HTH domain